MNAAIARVLMGVGLLPLNGWGMTVPVLAQSASAQSCSECGAALTLTMPQALAVSPVDQQNPQPVPQSPGAIAPHSDAGFAVLAELGTSPETPEASEKPAEAEGTSDPPVVETVPPAEPGKPADPAAPRGDGESAHEVGADLAPEARRDLLIEADRLWLQGRYTDAEFLYRKAKTPFVAIAVAERPPAFSDPALLSPEGRVFWREAEAGRDQNLPIRMMVALKLLTEQQPEFIPAQVWYANALLDQGDPETALQALERAASLYSDEPDLIRARVAALAANDQWLEASIAARQFALLYPNDPNAAEFQALADEHLEEFRDELREKLTGNAIANGLVGALGAVLTGGWFGPLNALQTTIVLLRGESSVGESVADQIAERLPLIQDEAVVAYVDRIGQRLAAATGRNNFEYEFYVVRDPDLNAFALPGGKIFINAGAILKTESEAELAALLAHELGHSVLSHGFQLMVDANLTSNVLQFVPYGGLLSDLAFLNYSRDMERQADAFGTRLLVSTGYAADGVHSLMQILDEQEGDRGSISWLSTHPDTSERLRNLEQQIERNGYNRYAYEGIEQHTAIQQRVRALMGEPESDKNFGER